MSNEKWILAGKRLRELRKQTGLSLFKVARKNHISGNYLSLLERGKQSPSDTVIYNLAEFYNVPSSELFALYGKLEPTEIKELLAVPHLRKILTQISVEKKLSDKEKEEIAKSVYELSLDLMNKKED